MDFLYYILTTTLMLVASPFLLFKCLISSNFRKDLLTGNWRRDWLYGLAGGIKIESDKLVSNIGISNLGDSGFVYGISIDYKVH